MCPENSELHSGGAEDLLVEVECSGFQCVLEDPRFLGYQVVFKGSGCSSNVRMCLLGLCSLKKQCTVGVRYPDCSGILEASGFL